MDNGQQDPNPPPIAHPDFSVREHSGRSLRARSHHRQEDQMQVGWKQSPQSAPRREGQGVYEWKVGSAIGHL